MAITQGNQAQVLLDEFNLHQFARSFNTDAMIDLHDASVLGTTSRIKQPGLKHATASADMLLDDTEDTGPFDVLIARYGSATAGILSYAPLNFGIGNPAVLMYAHQVSLTPKSIVDDLNTIIFNAEAAEDAADFGVSLHAYAAETSSTNSASVDNAAATTNGGVGVIHLTAKSGTVTPTLTVKIQDSTNNSVWTDLISFTALTVVGKQRVELAAGAAVKRYLRAMSTISGTNPSFTYSVSFARR